MTAGMIVCGRAIAWCQMARIQRLIGRENSLSWIIFWNSPARPRFEVYGEINRMLLNRIPHRPSIVLVHFSACRWLPPSVYQCLIREINMANSFIPARDADFDMWANTFAFAIWFGWRSLPASRLVGSQATKRTRQRWKRLKKSSHRLNGLTTSNRRFLISSFATSRDRTINR